MNVSFPLTLLSFFLYSSTFFHRYNMFFVQNFGGSFFCDGRFQLDFPEPISDCRVK